MIPWSAHQFLVKIYWFTRAIFLVYIVIALFGACCKWFLCVACESLRKVKVVESFCRSYRKGCGLSVTCSSSRRRRTIICLSEDDSVSIDVQNPCYEAGWVMSG